MLKRLQRKIVLPVTLTEAWGFFSNPANLALITPPKLNFVISSDVPEKVYAGAIIAYKVHPFLGIPLTWVTEITHVKECEYFVDEQRYGPYRLWHHQHLFKETDSGVEIEDIVDYILPFGPLGLFVHSLFVKRQLDSIFEYRSRVLRERWPVVE